MLQSRSTAPAAAAPADTAPPRGWSAAMTAAAAAPVDEALAKERLKEKVDSVELRCCVMSVGSFSCSDSTPRKLADSDLKFQFSRNQARCF